MKFGVSIALSFAAISHMFAANPAVEPVSRPGDWWDALHRKYVDSARQGNIDVLFLGDSITQYWTDENVQRGGKSVWDREFASLGAACFGIAGDRTQYLLWRLQNGEAEGFQPKVVVLLIGTNNTGNRNTPNQAAEGVAAVVNELTKRFPKAKILLLSLLPRGGKDHPQGAHVVEINRLLPGIADGKKIIYVDIWEKFLSQSGDLRPEIMPDLIHPNLEGYEIFASAIREPLRAASKE